MVFSSTPQDVFFMIKFKLILFVFLFKVLPSSSQDNPGFNFKNAILEEFELLNLCHCHEYLMLRHYDYVKWKTAKDKKKRIDEEKHLVFGQYRTGRQFGVYYQQKYDSSLFYKKGISILLEDTRLNFKRLDSLYYEPIVQHYVREETKSNPIPYLGVRHNNFFWDCFHKIKEMPLKQELEFFIQANQQN